MNKKRTLPWIFVLLALALIVPTYVSITSHRAQATPTTYYVDQVNGSDLCNGTSPNPATALPNPCAWQSVGRVNQGPSGTGDSFISGNIIKFEDGDIWQESNQTSTKAFLRPKGDGTGTPVDGAITISHYCNTQLYQDCSTRNKPELDGMGDMATVELIDQSYWNINYLTITNLPSGCSTQPPPATCPNALRYGIYVLDDSPSVTTYHHIYLTYLDVHNVVGYDIIQHKTDATVGKVTGGIVFEVESGASLDPADYGGSSHSSFDDILVSNNIIHDVYRSGIFMHSDWQSCINNDCSTYPCNLTDQTHWVPLTNVLVDSNTVYNTGGSGIGVQVSQGQVISNNTVHDGQLDGWAAEGIATLDSYQPVDKHNIVYNMKYNGADGNGYPTDAVAFDTDDCDYGAIIEYNWSHDNQGGFMAVPEDSQHAIVRYNISERDGYGSSGSSGVPGYFMINAHDNWTGSGMKVYNNDIFMDDLVHLPPGPGTGLLQNPFVTSQNITPPFFENNLVENLQTGTKASCSSDTLTPQLPNPGVAWTVDFNDFWGAPASGICPNTPIQSHAIPGDPEFAHPGNGHSETTIAGVITDYTIQTAAPASPALCKGTIIDSNNGGLDFAGHPISSNWTHVDGGALQGSLSCTN